VAPSPPIGPFLPSFGVARSCWPDSPDLPASLAPPLGVGPGFSFLSPAGLPSEVLPSAPASRPSPRWRSPGLPPASGLFSADFSAPPSDPPDFALLGLPFFSPERSPPAPLSPSFSFAVAGFSPAPLGGLPSLPPPLPSPLPFLAL